ncbi:MAG: c-type cytochrome [Rhodospirillales bacterium]
MIRAGSTSVGAALLAFVAATGPVAAAGDAAAGRWLAEEFGCNSCHGLTTDGDAAAPHIAGQKKDYLARQLHAFREARAKTPGPYKVFERDHPVMTTWTRPLTDTGVDDLSEYFAGLPCVPRRSYSETQAPRPPLVDRCRFCHGETGVNPYVGYPNIGGQKKTYLVRQLLAFRKSADHGGAVIKKNKDERFHRMMAPSVYDLKDDEIETLAEYYSRQSCR